jgi:uncharacterized protein (TIGR02391 family)
MNLETRLSQPLWNAVKTSFEARNYTAAILDAIHALSDLIRERTDLDGDGVSLVGAALGGNTPRLKVNRLRTESEQNIQRGVEALLRGLYQAVRNPRSHGKVEDEEKDAVAVILFVDYLMRVVGQSKSPFSLEAFVQRVLDQGFVPKKQYADLLVSRIPARKRLAVCREVFSRCERADGTKVRFFFESALAVLSDDEREEFLSIISDELFSTDDEGTVRFILQSLPSSLWTQLDEVARLRIENMLIDSVRCGRWMKESSQCIGGGLGTWITNIHKEVGLKDDLWRAVCGKLNSTDEMSKAYIFKFFIQAAPDIFEEPPRYLIQTMNRGLQSGDVRFKNVVEAWKFDLEFCDEDAADNPWITSFQKALASMPQGASTQDEEDDIPF